MVTDKKSVVSRRHMETSLCVDACRITHVIGILSVSQLHFLANKNAELLGLS